MKFNTNLLKGLNNEQRELGKLILFAINEDIRIDGFLTTNSDLFDYSISWKDDILMDCQSIMKHFIDNGVVISNYSENNVSRWKLLRPLYVNSLEERKLSDEKIKQLRKYFGKRYCGQSRQSTFELVKEKLNAWVEKNQDCNLGIIEDVFKYYIDSKLEKDSKGTYVANIINFIDITGEAGKELNLLSAYEEYEDGNRSSKEDGIFSY